MRLLALFLLLIAVPAAAGEVAPQATAICPILPGEIIPEGMTARTASGEEIDLTAALAGPTILIVYRGGWCPYCNAHMQEIQSIEGDLIDLGYRIVVLSPSQPSKAAEMQEKLSTSSIQVLSDSTMEACAALGIAFQVDAATVEMYQEYKIDLVADSGYDHHQLPVPAAFVITGSAVRFVYTNPNYKLRVDGSVLLAAAAAARANESGR